MGLVAFANIGWNTVSALKVAAASGIVTFALSKSGHYFLRRQQDIKEIGSLTIRAFALTLGLIAGFYALRKIITLEMCFDHTHILGSFIWGTIANLTYFTFFQILSRVRPKSGALLNVGTSLMFLSHSCIFSTPLINDLGKAAFIPAVVVGAAAGAYL